MTKKKNPAAGQASFDELEKWMVAWDPDEPMRVMVGPWPDLTDWSEPYSFTSGWCFLGLHKASREAQWVRIFTEFNCLVVRDGIDPQAAHREFLKIADYRRLISPDIAGARLSEHDGGWSDA